MNLTSAKSQKSEDKPISFVLESADGSMKRVSLFIRPEDLSINSTSRMSVNQTLGGAWIDSFGDGLQAVTISGTTGWRTAPNGKDGIDRMIELKNEFFSKWHQLRADAIKAGTDPNAVKLRYVDTLNRYARVVAPQIFEVKRSKSRPLLGMYRFSFTAVSGPQPIVLASALAGFGADPSGFGLDSLVSSLNSIRGYIATAKNWINANLLAPVTGFMNMSHRLLTNVQATIRDGLSLAVPVINLARTIAQTGVNVFRTLAAVAGIPGQVKATLMQVASAYSNIFCVLRNALKTPKTYENYGGLYGASNCSSTFGGSPPSRYAETNPFFAVSPAVNTSTGVTNEAAGSMNSIIRSDVILSPMTPQQIGNSLTTINAGVQVA